MRNRDAFSGYHPIINFLYFALVLLFSMCLMHPVYLAISLVFYDVYPHVFPNPLKCLVNLVVSRETLHFSRWCCVIARE